MVTTDIYDINDRTTIHIESGVPNWVNIPGYTGMENQIDTIDTIDIDLGLHTDDINLTLHTDDTLDNQDQIQEDEEENDTLDEYDVHDPYWSPQARSLSPYLTETSSPLSTRPPPPPDFRNSPCITARAKYVKEQIPGR